MSDGDTPKPLHSYIHVKHGFAFEGHYFCDEPTQYVLVTPGNFAIGGGFQEGKAKYYNGPVPQDYVLREGDLVVTMTDLSKAGDTLGYPGIIPSVTGRIYLHNQRIGRISIIDSSQLDRDYLYYLLRTDAYRNHILATASGSTVRHTSPSRICEFTTQLLPPSEQRAVAGALRSLDEKIDQNRRTSRVVEELARATFKAWFVDFEPVKAKAAGQTSFPGMPPTAFTTLPNRLTDSPIGPVPQGWAVMPLSQACRIVSGGTPKRSEADYWGGDILWYSVKDAPPDGMPWVISTDERITQAGLDGSAATLVPIGCTIISARGTVGRLALAARPMTFNQSCYGLLPIDHASYRHLHLLIRQVVGELQQRTHGSVFDTITRQTFDGVNVVYPTAALLAAFENVTAPLFDLLLSTLTESHKLAEIRDYLLPRLLSGTTRVETHRA